MPSWGSFSYAFGPLVAAAVLVALVVVLRWAFHRGESVVAAPPRSGTPTEYGMLAPVAAPVDAGEAERVAQALKAAGVPCTVARTTQGLRVLVWPQQRLQAEQALRSWAEARRDAQ